MTDVLTFDALARAFSDALAAACGERLGADATAAPSELPADAGWLLAVPVTGLLTGRVTVWFDRASAQACTRAIAGDAEPGDDAIQALLVELVQAAAAAVVATPAGEGAVLGAATVAQGIAPQGATATYVAVPNTASCLFAVSASQPEPTTTTSSSSTGDERLGVVLDVDLPLIVRFGQVVMPLRDLAALGPGSVIDMGRAPDEPVELLVGERLIARGDVVVVGGNYGMRITELAAGRPRPAQKETAA